MGARLAQPVGQQAHQLQQHLVAQYRLARQQRQQRRTGQHRHPAFRLRHAGCKAPLPVHHRHLAQRLAGPRHGNAHGIVVLVTAHHIHLAFHHQHHVVARIPLGDQRLPGLRRIHVHHRTQQARLGVPQSGKQRRAHQKPVQLLGKARARTQRLQATFRQSLGHPAACRHMVADPLFRLNILARRFQRHDFLNLVHSPCLSAAQKGHIAVTWRRTHSSRRRGPMAAPGPATEGRPCRPRAAPELPRVAPEPRPSHTSGAPERDRDELGTPPKRPRDTPHEAPRERTGCLVLTPVAAPAAVRSPLRPAPPAPSRCCPSPGSHP